MKDEPNRRRPAQWIPVLMGGALLVLCIPGLIWAFAVRLHGGSLDWEFVIPALIGIFAGIALIHSGWLGYSLYGYDRPDSGSTGQLPPDAH